jgi:hypothetical protein
MSSLLVLPAPLPSTALTVGQLITDPLANKSASLAPSRAPPSEQTTQSNYQATITYDDNGRFTSTNSPSNPPSSSHPNLLNLTASKMTHTTLSSPTAFFNQLRRDTATRTFLRNMTQHQTPVYFVTSLQTVHAPVFRRAPGTQDCTEVAPDSPHFRLSVRRVDSASDMHASSTGQQNADGDDANNECVLAVELRKVKCCVGASSEPHALEDVEFEWSYHGLEDVNDEDENEDDDGQLAIGLGKPLEVDEFRTLAGMPVSRHEDIVADDEASEASDDEGIGGF